MNPTILELVQLGVEVTLKWDPSTEEVYYDLGAGTKSGMYAREDGHSDRLIVTGRYSEEDPAYNLADLLGIYAQRFRARGYGDDRWTELAVEHGYLRRSVKEVVEYS